MTRPIAWLLATVLAGCQNVQQPAYDPFVGRTLPPPALRTQPTPANPYYAPGTAPTQPAWPNQTIPLGPPPAGAAPATQPTTPPLSWPTTPAPNSAGFAPNRSAPAVNPPAMAQPNQPVQPYANPGAYGPNPYGAPPPTAYPAGPTTGLPPRTPYGAQPAPTFRPTSNPYPSQPVTIPPDMPGAGDNRTTSRPITIPREALDMPTTVTVRRPPFDRPDDGLTPEDVPYPDPPGSPKRAGAADAPRLPKTAPAQVSPSQQAFGAKGKPAQNSVGKQTPAVAKRTPAQSAAPKGLAPQVATPIAAVAADQPFPWRLPISAQRAVRDTGIRTVAHEEIIEIPAAEPAKPTGKSNRRMARLKPEQVSKALPRQRRVVVGTVPAVRAPAISGVITAVAEEEGGQPRVATDESGLQALPSEEAERIEPRKATAPTVKTKTATGDAEIDQPPAATTDKKPLETEPAEKTTETTPTETKPVEPKTEEPTTTEPTAEPKPAAPKTETPEAKPEEPKAEESKPAESKAAEKPQPKEPEPKADESSAEKAKPEPEKPAAEAPVTPEESPTPEKAETPEEPAKPAPEKPAPATKKPFDYAADYTWIRGPVEHLEAEGCWKLRYIPFDGDTDQYGGSVVLRNLPGTARLKSGETVTVRGKLTRDKPTAAGFAPYYQVQSVER